MLPTLSRGWGTALASVLLACILFAFACFVGFLRWRGNGDPIFMVIFLVLPLALAQDVTRASSECDTLHIHLNRKRAADLSEARPAQHPCVLRFGRC